jgi:FtsH-binding integral membrane protein
MSKKCATSSIYDTIYGGQKKMSGGAYEGGGGASRNLEAIIYQKKDFLVKIFANLITQLGVTYYIMMNYDYKKDRLGLVKKRIWVVVVLLLITISVIALVPMNMYLKFGAFTFFSALNGLLLSRLMQHVDPTIVEVAILGTIGIFGALFLVGALLLSSGIVLGLRLGLFLLFALLVLIIALITSLFMGPDPIVSKYLTGIGLVLFSVYIVYDTNRILQKDYYGDFITASLDYYLDIINVFIRMVAYGRSG